MRGRQRDGRDICPATGHLQYSSRRHAAAAMQRMIRNGGLGHFSTFRCVWCWKFHFGHDRYK